MRVAVVGAGGQLGTELVRAFTEAGSDVVAFARPEFELAEAHRLSGRLDGDVVVNAAAWTDVDGCARDPERAMALNGVAVGWIAEAADRAAARFVHVSTNEVFDGTSDRPYLETDATNPINAYGRSKLEGERLARRARQSVIVRTAWIFGGPRSFPVKILAAARRGEATATPLRVVDDEFGNPTPAAVLARRMVQLALAGDPPPTVHLAGVPPTSRFGWASLILERHGLPPPVPIPSADYERPSRTPLRAVLDTSLAGRSGLQPIGWEDADAPPDPPKV